MNEFSYEQLKDRAFERVAYVLHHFWEEQQHVMPRSASVHTRIFDTLVPDHFIDVGRSEKGGGHREHLVPCVYLRDLAFEMFWSGKTVQDVAIMIGRLLRVAHITPDEARWMDIELKLKTKMPENWHPETGSVFARLDEAKIKLMPKKEEGES